MKSLRGAISSKEQLCKTVIKIANSCKSFDELSLKLKVKGIDTYYRNNTLTGVWYGGRKYRLLTLGVDKSHLQKLSKEQQRIEKLKQIQRNDYNDREVEQ